MPHVRDVAPTSHDRHDPMLVAALAAGDLAGTERDQAIALTGSCAECATLHADLVAIAHATASVPPPISAPSRDYRLTADRAASLRRTGWRRLVPAGLERSSLTRPVGVALATFGLVGLLVGTIPLNFGALGSAASAPAAAPSRDLQELNGVNDHTGTGGAAGAGAAAAGGPVASAAAATEAPRAAASAAPAASIADAGVPPSSQAVALNPVPAASVPGTVGVATVPSADVNTGAGKTTDRGTPSTVEPPAGTSGPSQLVLVSIVAIALGAALFVIGRRREHGSA